jgi:hypothetical protein
MSQRFVNTSLGDFNGRTVAVACVQKKNAEHLLVEKLHVGASPIDRFRIVELLRTGVLSFGYSEHAQSSSNSLGLTLWKELP